MVAIFSVKMVVLWCCLFQSMIVSRYSLGLRGGFLLVMVDLPDSCNLKLSSINSDQKYLCIFPTIILCSPCWGIRVARWMVWGEKWWFWISTLVNYSHQSILLEGNGGVFWDLLTRVPLGEERGNFLTRVFFRGRTGDISIFSFLLNGARMRTGVVLLLLGHCLFIFSQWRTTWLCVEEIWQL